jgi:hypothetical protein
MHFPRSLVRPAPSLPFRGGRGVWGENWDRAVILLGRGGSGFLPSAFPDWSPLLSVYLCSRAVVFLTSTTLLCEGLRSGTRRRRGASASAQAGGETGPETRCTASTQTDAALCGQCAGFVIGLWWAESRYQRPCRSSSQTPHLCSVKPKSSCNVRRRPLPPLTELKLLQWHGFLAGTHSLSR